MKLNEIPDPTPLTVAEVAAKLLALPDQDSTLVLWCGGDYGPHTVEEIESPVSIGTGTMEPDPGTTLVRLV